MRIISQDGTIDLPYANFSLSITQDNCIVAARDVVARPKEMLIGVVAKYSTKAKARKAMEMLFEAYRVYFQYKTMTAEQRAVFLNCTNEKEQEKLYEVFRFPADDEVEV